jgi:hypothetical protein
MPTLPTGHRRRGGDRRLDSHPGTSTAREFTAAKRRDPPLASAPPMRGIRAFAAPVAGQDARSEGGCPLAAQGGEVGVRAAMLVAPPEQVSHNRSLASSAIDRALPFSGHEVVLVASHQYRPSAADDSRGG